MLQVFVLLLLSFFTLSLAQLCHLYWIRHWFPDPKAVALHSAVHRLLKPRSPHDSPPVASPLPSRRVWSRRLHLCAPGAR